MAVSSQRAVVIANGDLHPSSLRRVCIEPSDFIVCVDGGLTHALHNAIKPDLLVGDFDSVEPLDLEDAKLRDVERLSFSIDKDASDLELALDTLEQRKFADVVLLGVSGGRTDHSLFNWMLPARPWAYRLRLLDQTTDAHVITAQHPYHLSAEKGNLLSLLALTNVTGVTTSGLEYPLEAASIRVGSSLGLSNVVSDEAVSVTLDKGVMLAIMNL